MNINRLSILIVDDTKFSSAIVAKTLTNAGYKDIRSARSALEALELIKERPIDILLADWMMPDMDGLELTQRIRELDEASGVYTYTILLTAKDGTDNFAAAFEAGVDDFINKSMMKEQLVPRIMAASRLVERHNLLLKQNAELLVAKHQLEIINTTDPLTKIGNLKYAYSRIQDTLKHVESRGGALCYLVSVAKRIQQLVRPMDGVTRVGETEFGVIQHQNTMDVCQGKIFKRVIDGLNIKPYETEAGFINLKISMSLFAVDNRQEFLPNPETVIDEARVHIKPERAGIDVTTHHWSAVKTSN
jgi:PleD family two-component response regulator